MADREVAADDREFEPSAEPKSSRIWLNMIEQAEKALNDWQDRADNIDKLYANLSVLSNASRDREFQMFWANIEVLKPSVYSRPPVPVVVPRFKDRRPIPRVASELLERAAVVAFDLTDVDAAMLLVRDDLAISARGVLWVRYETKEESAGESERVCIEHLDRKDFLHEPARKWSEVGWVARRGWMTANQLKDRFKDIDFDHVRMEIRRDEKDTGGVTRQEKAGVWEIWSKTEDKVVWVVEGVEDVLEQDKPHLKLEGFYPCPRPAYGTTQRRSLVPVPDMLFYKDQLEEINALTGRISALTDAVKVRGFYAAGQAETGAAIETAMKSTDDRQIMVPISSMAAFGTGSSALIVWLPIDMIVTTIAALVEQRRQIVDDVYQITGLSDIMRGATDPKETLGAQQLKSQYGSIRIRDRQAELVRIARDAGRIAAEIMAENFGKKTLLDMSQMELPTDADIKRDLKELEATARRASQEAEKQAQQAAADPQRQQMKQQDPEKAKAAAQEMQQAFQSQMSQFQAQATELKETVTINQVMDLLREQRLRPFVLDIETDSTIQPDEDAEKQRRTEYATALGGLIQQFAPVIQVRPEMGAFFGELLKFTTAPFRAGRQMEGTIDEMVEKLSQQAGQPQPNPEAEKLKSEQALEQQRMQFEQKRTEAEMQMKGVELQTKMQIESQKAQADRETAEFDRQSKREEAEAKMRMIDAQMQRDERKGALEERKLTMELQAKEQELTFKAQSAQIDMQRDAQTAQREEIAADRQEDRDERAFQQSSALAAQKAAKSQARQAP